MNRIKVLWGECLAGLMGWCMAWFWLFVAAAALIVLGVSGLFWLAWKVWKLCLPDNLC